MTRFKKIIVLPSVLRGGRGGLKLGSKAPAPAQVDPKKPGEKRS